MKPKYEKWLTPSGLIDLEELAYNCRGITALQAKLGIGQSTMHRWREHIEIDEAIERGLARANKKSRAVAGVARKAEGAGGYAGLDAARGCGGMKKESPFVNGCETRDDAKRLSAYIIRNRMVSVKYRYFREMG